jgi:glucokinase
MGNEFVLAGDVGGTHLRLAAVAGSGSVLHQVTVPTPDTGAADDVVQAIIRAAKGCCDAVGESRRPVAFGLAIAALVNSSEGLILDSPNLPELNELELGKVLSEKLQLKVVLENDATAAAIGEHWLGSSKSVDDSVFVTLGTGVGGGLILSGSVYRGVDGTAGEIGHICVEPEGIACGCGSKGCVEQYASATAIVRIARELALHDPASSLNGKAKFSSKDVYDAAVDGDPVGLEAFRIMGRYLGIALAGIVDVLNPELIVIGGGAAAGWDLFIDHLRTEIAARAFRHPAERVRILRASLGEEAGILGAARVALDSTAVPEPDR